MKKFKKGDRVRLIDPKNIYMGQLGTVISVYHSTNWAREPNAMTVKFDHFKQAFHNQFFENYEICYEDNFKGMMEMEF